VVTNAELVVADGLVVSLDYTLRLDDGQVLDTSQGEAPLDFLQGAGQIIPGLEAALYGMAVGDEKEVEVAPADGYGEKSLDAFELIPRDAFPADLELTLGMGLQLQSESGEELVAYVADLRPEEVLLDLNHPLAGETLFFDIRIAGLRPATAEELAHGHAHSSGHAH
jgi:FKBP-type peptidyl-prolyl cis-trans isomerase SlyD